MVGSKALMWVSIISGIIVVLFTLLFFVSGANASCDDDDHLMSNSSNMCYYFSGTCAAEENKGILNQVAERDEILPGMSGTEPVCYYEATGFITSKSYMYVLLFSFIFWALVFTIFYVRRGRQVTDTDTALFKKADFVNADDVEGCWAQSWSRKYGIPLVGGEYKRSAFRFSGDRTPAQLANGEWVHKFECEVFDPDCTNNGMFTTMVSMSRGKDWILNGNYDTKAGHYYAHKRERAMPLFTHQNPTERIIETLRTINPDRAAEIAEAHIESQVRSPQPPPQPSDVPPTVVVRQPPRRRPYRRYR